MHKGYIMGTQEKSFEDIKILIVEDQDDTREMMVSMLKNIGLRKVFSVEDGAHAMRYIQHSLGHLDMIVCDWNIPEKSGVDVLRELRMLRSDIPFLMVTGRKDMDSVFEAQKLGVSGYLSKPFSARAFEQKLRLLTQHAN